MSFRQDRTNPSTAVSNWKGRTDTPKAWPSTRVATWMNGGLFGGGDPSWVMEVIAATTAGTHANFYIGDVKTNAHDGKTYISGFWDNYYGGGYQYDYGPLVGQLKDDGSADLEWWTMCWYNSTTYRAIGQHPQLSFAPGSSDVYVASRFERGSTGCMWARFNSSGTLQNASNAYTFPSGGGLYKIATDGTNVVSIGSGAVGGYTRFIGVSWPYDSANAVATAARYGYTNWYSGIDGPSDGATYYTNGGTGYAYGLPKDYNGYMGRLMRVPMNASNMDLALFTGFGTQGTLGIQGDGANTAGLSFSGYPTYFGMINASTPSISWSKTLTASSGSVQIANDAAPYIDPDGNVYAFGQDDSKAFIIKLDSSGTVLWQRHLSVSTAAGSNTSQMYSVGGNQDGTMVYASMYVGSLQYGGSGATKFPRMVVWKIKADGSDSGSATIDNSSGTGSGDEDVFTIAASSITVNAGSVGIGAWATPTSGNAGPSHQNDALAAVTPWSGNSNLPVLVAENLA